MKNKLAIPYITKSTFVPEDSWLEKYNIEYEVNKNHLIVSYDPKNKEEELIVSFFILKPNVFRSLLEHYYPHIKKINNLVEITKFKEYRYLISKNTLYKEKLDGTEREKIEN